MSFDLCIWDSGIGAPEEIYSDACDGRDHRLTSGENVVLFRSNLLDRWVTLRDFVEPLEYDPETGQQANIDKYLIFTVPISLIDEVPEIVKLARRYGLTIYDPQVEQVLH